MKNTFTTLLMTSILAVSCGNPHLIESDDNKAGTNIADNQTIEEGQIRKIIEVKNLDGGTDLNYGILPTGTESRKILIVKNISIADQELQYSFERGGMYNYSGGAFPGLNGTCGTILQANTECRLEVEFQSSKIGIFEDYLVVANRAGKLSVPLSGERKYKDGEEPGKVIFNKNVLGAVVDYGIIPVGSKITKEIELSNLTEVDVRVSELRISNSKEFKIEDYGNCLPIVTRAGCKILVSYNPSIVGTQTALLEAKDQGLNVATIELKGKGKVDSDCYKIKEQTVEALPKRSVISKNIELPYLTKVSNGASLSIIYGTGFNTHIKGGSINIVKDAMVLVDFDLSKLDLSDIVDAKVNLNAWKIIADNYKDTEMLCLVSKNLKRCSGRIFVLDNWKKLLNAEFWEKGSLVNELFETKLAASERECGSINCQTVREEISLKELFNLTNDDLKTLKENKGATLVVADDTRFLTLPTIKFRSEKKVSCQ